MKTSKHTKTRPQDEAQSISGGYIHIARKIDQSEIAHAAPVTRETWLWLLRRANFADSLSSGLKRGQCLCRIADIQEELHWFKGYCKESYTKAQCEGALDFLRKRNMITTRKTTRGMIITICKYDCYQTSSNYVSDGEGRNKATSRKQDGSTINNKKEKEKRKKTIDTGLPVAAGDRASEDNFFIDEPKGIWTYNESYDTELAKCEGYEMAEGYRALVSFLFGENTNRPLRSVLKLEKQIGYNEYVELKYEERRSQRTLRDVLEGMENWKLLTRKNTDAYRTTLDWLRKGSQQKAAGNG